MGGGHRNEFFFMSNGTRMIYEYGASGSIVAPAHATSSSEEESDNKAFISSLILDLSISFFDDMKLKHEQDK